MDTTKQQGLVARHEHVDARVWNQFYGGWFPLAPWSSLDVSYRAELGVSQGKAMVPLSHPCANIFRQMRDGVPAPLSIEVNGVFISGQITYAQAESDGEKQIWDLTIKLDQNHAHSMLVRAPIQSAADSADTRISGFLGPVARQLIAGASSRTGLPTYIIVDGEGDPVDVSARNDDTVAGVLEPALSGSNLFVDVRMLLPGQKIPGMGPVERFAGNLERQWENAALDAGLWPHAETNPRITDMVAGPDGVIPPFSWHGEASVDHLGNVLPEPVEGYVWVPFATQAPEIGSSYYTPDRPILDGTRVVTPAELEAHADDFPGWSSFVTVWEPGAVFSELRENEALHEAAKVGLLALPDGTKLPADWGELGPLLDAYVGLDRSGITTPGVYAWRDGPTWIIANAADMQAEKDKRAANLAQKQTPGVLFHFYGERDRREIVFSSVPGGGLKSWSIGYAAPSAAMLIAGAQLDEWTMQQMGMGALPEQAITGEQSSVPADASAMKNIPPVVDQIDVDVQPQARLEGSDVAYHTAGGRVDLSKAGPFFYREKYLNLGNAGTMNPVQQMVQEWGKSQGSTTASFTPAGNQNVVFGDDIVGADGRVIKGWRHGDRVSFVDGDTRVSEIIIGWRLVANAGEPLDVSPILGREDHGVMAQLGDRIRGSEKASRKNQLAPPRRLPVQEIEDTFNREASEWSRIVQEQLDEGRQHVEDAKGHAEDARANASAAFGYAELAVGLVDEATIIIGEAQEKLDTIPAIIEAGRQHVIRSASFSASSQVHSMKAMVHADQADSFALLSQGFAAEAQALVDAADIVLDSAQEKLDTIPGIIAAGEQHVTDAKGHAEQAALNAATAFGYVGQAELILNATGAIRDAAQGALSDTRELLDDVDGDGTSLGAALLVVANRHQDVLEWHDETLTAHEEAIRLTAAAAGFAAAAAVDATETAESAASAAARALDAVGVLAQIQQESIEVDRLQNRAISAAASSASMASFAAAQAAETGRQAALAASDAASAAQAAGEAADDALDATNTLALIQADVLTVQGLHGDAIRAVAASASFAAAAAVDATETAESAVSAADAALDAIEAMNEALLRQEQASGDALASAISAQDASEQALLAQQIGWRKFVHPGTRGATLMDDRVVVMLSSNGLNGQVYERTDPAWAGEISAKVYFANGTVRPYHSPVPIASQMIFGGGNTEIVHIEVDYRDSQRVARRSVDKLSTGWAVPANNAWYQHKTGRPWSVTVPHATELSAVFFVGWDAAGYLGSYSIQVRVNGVARKTVRNEGFGPQFFWQGGGYRTQMLTLTGAETLSLNGGDTVSFWVIRERNGNTVVPDERKIRDFSLSVAWSEME